VKDEQQELRNVLWCGTSASGKTGQNTDVETVSILGWESSSGLILPVRLNGGELQRRDIRLAQ